MFSPISERYVSLYDARPIKETEYVQGKLQTTKTSSGNRYYKVDTSGYNIFGKVLVLSVVSGSIRFLTGVADILIGNDRKIAYTGFLNVIRGAFEVAPGVYLYTKRANLDPWKLIAFFLSQFLIFSIYDSIFNKKKKEELPVYERGVLPKHTYDTHIYN